MNLCVSRPERDSIKLPQFSWGGEGRRRGGGGGGISSQRVFPITYQVVSTMDRASGGGGGSGGASFIIN